MFIKFVVAFFAGYGFGWFLIQLFVSLKDYINNKILCVGYVLLAVLFIMFFIVPTLR